MRRTITVLLFCLFPLQTLAADPPLTRLEGFRMLWEPLRRSTEQANGGTFDDVSESHVHFRLLTFAKARGVLEDEPEFRPEEPLRLKDAVLWLLRSRNVDQPSDIVDATLPQFLAYYPLLENPAEALAENPTVTGQELQKMMEKLDTFLRRELHTVSFYAEEFAGKGTAFGETFDPAAFTAAHRYLPHNTLVRVTAHDINCLPSEAPQGGAKEGQLPAPRSSPQASEVGSTVNCPTRSVVVRINDRGPYADGRDMDLSLAAFELLAPRSVGVLNAVTFERLGEATVEEATTCPGVRYRRRLGHTLLNPGIPWKVIRGHRLQLSAPESFRVLQIIPPRGRPIRYEKWTRRGETVDIHFVQPGTYVLVLLADSGKRQRFRTEVVRACS